MPFGPKNMQTGKTQFVDLVVADNSISNKKVNFKIRVEKIDTIFQAYMTPDEYLTKYNKRIKEFENETDDNGTKKLYGKNLYMEVQRYAAKVGKIVEEMQEEFDVIHAHDWMTILAGIQAKKVSKKPLVVHVHNTVYDRYLGEGGGFEKEIEQKGVNYADKVIAISYKIRDTLKEKYGVPENKIETVHNGGVTDINKVFTPYNICQKKDKYVLYAGRVVLQKGPEYFVRAAQKVLEYEPNTKFILAGDGHQLDELKELAHHLGIYDNIYFHGFYNRQDADKFFNMADIFVMPSQSEPFGLVPLEAIAKGTPTIISKQSGISEVLHNCFKVDFWDVDELANKIVSLLRYEPLHNHMRKLAFNEFDKFHWEKPAKKILDIYKDMK